MGEIRAFKKRTRWTPEEEAILRAHYPTASHETLRALLGNRGIRKIQCKANWLGLVREKPPKITPEERLRRKREDMARRWRENPEAMREYARKNHERNREQRNERLRALHARRLFWSRAMKVKGVTPKQLASLWKTQRGRCALTGRRLDRAAQLDHILPRARGGTDEISNLRWVCDAANLAKRDLTDEEFAALCADVMHWIGQQIAAAASSRIAA